jgi:hypothetical protein
MTLKISSLFWNKKTRGSFHEIGMLSMADSAKLDAF